MLYSQNISLFIDNKKTNSPSTRNLRFFGKTKNALAAGGARKRRVAERSGTMQPRTKRRLLKTAATPKIFTNYASS